MYAQAHLRLPIGTIHAHLIWVSAAFTNLREFYLIYPIPTHGKNKKGQPQAFRFMVGPGHCPMISKYGPSPSKAVDPSFLIVKNSHFNKTVHLTASHQKEHVGCQYSKTCLKQPFQERQNKDFNNKW